MEFMSDFQQQKSLSVDKSQSNLQYDALYEKLVNRNKEVARIIGRFRKACLQHGPIIVNRESLKLPELITKRTVPPTQARNNSQQATKYTRKFERAKVTLVESVKSEGSIELQPSLHNLHKRYGNENLNPSIVNLSIQHRELQLVNRSQNERTLKLEKAKKSKLLINNYRARREELWQAGIRIKQYEGQSIAVQSYGLLPKLNSLV